jgi:hypothetical protein
MAFKRLNFLINEKDVRAILARSLSSILSRVNKNINENANLLSEDLESMGEEELLLILSKMQEHYQRAIAEIDNLSPIVLPADAEVLEDLPDLEEDSLGIDGGSE